MYRAGNNQLKRTELTHQNLKDFEEKLSSQAAVSRKRERLVFSSKGEALNRDDLDLPNEEHKANLDMEGEGENDLENPNEAENEVQVNADSPYENDLKKDGTISILSRAEVQSLSKLSRKSYVDSLRNELKREREKRLELEKQVKQLAEAKKA